MSFDLSRRHLLLAGLFAAPWAAAARPALPLVLAQEAPADIDPAGYLVSEKLDGVRACWDGRQLRFRSGLPVSAPAWFTQRLPAVPLDGELWLGRGRFEALSGAVRRSTPDDAEWRALRYMVFELPGGEGGFSARAARLTAIAQQAAWPQLQAVAQTPVTDRAALQRRLGEVLRAGGEGLVLHRADAPYVTGRSADLLKLKPLHDAEAVVLAHLPGRGKHAGRLGALRVRTPEGVEFQIGTGFSDAERAAPPPPGTVVTYSYRGSTEAGVPRFASYLRVRGP
jgi:DNA ligase-1